MTDLPNSRMTRRLSAYVSSSWDALKESYWLVPIAMAIVAALVASALLQLDHILADRVVIELPWITAADAPGTRALLTAVAGSMITVTGVVFSITVVSLSLTSSQFGPRLLRNFLRSRVNQIVLGAFVSTFLYSLLVLRAVSDDSVPHLASAGAVVLVIVSVFTLIYFVHHTASSIQASSVTSRVASEIDLQLDNLFPDPIGQGPERAVSTPEIRRDRAVAVTSNASGYVRVLSGDAILEIAQARDVVLHVVPHPGDFVLEGGVLVRFESDGESFDAELENAIRGCFVLGAHRTAIQDVGFLTGQLVEIAVRALSPGVNDPETAVACIYRLANVLSKLARREMPSPVRVDASGAPRVVTPDRSFADFVDACFGEIRYCGAQNPRIAIALLDGLERCGQGCDDSERLDALAVRAREVLKTYEAAKPDSAIDTKAVGRALQAALATLGAAAG